MKKLKYIIEDSTIAEVLGVQNFRNEESAVLELVKNAFDAQAKEVCIIIAKNQMIIEDDGTGMDSRKIIESWMHVGKSDKDYEIGQEDDRRILAGSKGVGRFALARLGAEVILHSKMNGKTPIVWKTDWNTSSLDEGEERELPGTRIVIKHLRDNWTESRVKNLQYFLSRTYNDEVMKIWIEYAGNKQEVKKYFGEFNLGVHGVSEIQLFYRAESAKLICKILSDEFKEDVQKLCLDINLKEVEVEFDMKEELEYKQRELSEEARSQLLKGVGDFSAELYFSLKIPSLADAEKFRYKYRILEDRYDSGVILYRNSFSISSYEGEKDWLGFGKRSRLSPAAATHPSGAWRVRENQISGKVIIDKKNNKDLKDMSNRQGLEENDSYKLFVEIILTGIKCFERYRQNIIRRIVKETTPQKVKEPKIVDEVIKDPARLDQLSLEDKQIFLNELEGMRKENTDNQKQREQTEEKYRYDIRLLNVFATSGLKATSIAHEMHNSRNSIEENVDYIIKALKRYALWDIVCEPDNTAFIHRNIPGLLEKNRRLNRKMVSFMEVMLSESEKEQFYPEIIDMKTLFEDIKAVWEKDYSWIDISLNIIEGLSYRSAKDIFRVIFDNLILNSIQQNTKESVLKISIEISQKGKYLDLVYKDDGVGLPLKYRIDPMRILEVHETSRTGGHGIGMWIVNNTVLNSGGEILSIAGDDGFKICFRIGEKV